MNTAVAGLTRDQRKAHTREVLLAAARDVFARRGFHGASVDEIASQAGLSTGALYSNFQGKEHLFFVLMEREIDAYSREIAAVVRAPRTVDERARGGAERWMKIVEREPAMLMLFMEFWAYTARDPQARERVAASFARPREMLTGLVADAAHELELELTMPAEHLAVAIDALADGIARQKMTDPTVVPDDLMSRILTLLLAGATRPLQPLGDRSGEC